MVKPASISRIVPALAVVAALGATVAFAGPIEDRQAGMKQVGKAMGAFAAIVKGEKAYDAATVKTSADSMLEGFKKALPISPPAARRDRPRPMPRPRSGAIRTASRRPRTRR
jgi:cytochrome c556